MTAPHHVRVPTSSPCLNYMIGSESSPRRDFDIIFAPIGKTSGTVRREVPQRLLNGPYTIAYRIVDQLRIAGEIQLREDAAAIRAGRFYTDKDEPPDFRQ